MTLRLFILAATLFGGAAYLGRAERIEPVAIRESFHKFPMQIGSWRGERAADFDSKILTILGVDEYLNRIYRSDDKAPVGLYIGYYQSQRQGDSIHSPMNCLPGAGWLPVSKSQATIPVATSTKAVGEERQITVNRYVIQKGEHKQVVLYWYQSQGRVIASEYWSKVYMVLDAMRTNRTDASLVRVIVPTADLSAGAEAAAHRRAVEFVQRMFPLLGEYLPS
jgi:EpsI family protein